MQLVRPSDSSIPDDLLPAYVQAMCCELHLSQTVRREVIADWKAKREPEIYGDLDELRGDTSSAVIREEEEADVAAGAEEDGSDGGDGQGGGLGEGEDGEGEDGDGVFESNGRFSRRR